MEAQETKSRYLIRNLLKGLLWFAVIISVFILAEDYIMDNFQKDIDAIQDRPMLVYSIFFASEVFFGLVPPEFFMMVWILHKIQLSQYILNLTVLTILSYIAGVIGYYVGNNFSKLPVIKKLSERYLEQYQRELKRYGGYLVFVGAITPVPFSATCMLAGSVNLPFKNFLLICIARIIRFAVYGWMVWSFPNWFSF
jgi:membrane protein YqaA with SNARE-associated domain